MPQTFPTGIIVKGVAVITDTPGQESIIRLDGDAGTLSIGKANNYVTVTVQDSSRSDCIWLTGNGDLILNGSLWCGNLLNPGVRSFVFRGATGDFSVYHKRPTGELYEVLSFKAEDPVSMRAIFEIGGGDGAHGLGGQLLVSDFRGHRSFYVDGESATAVLGNDKNTAKLILKGRNDNDAFHFEGNRGSLTVKDIYNNNVLQFESDNAVLIIGGKGKNGNILIRNTEGKDVIHLRGDTGDIILKNADVAEQFPIKKGTEIVPGSVMILDNDGTLIPSIHPYDQKVVGVVPGASDYVPGILMDYNESEKQNRIPISVVGKTTCLADASYGPISPGDLLTTSATIGSAMKVINNKKAFGAIFGKALSSLREGRGLINILVTLQ